MRTSISLCALTGLVVVGMTTATASAQTSFEYGPTFTTGQVIKTEVSIEADQDLTIAGMLLESGNTSFVVTEETVTQANGSTAKFTGKIASFQANINLPGGLSINFDSGNPDAANEQVGPLAQVVEFMKLMSTATWTKTMKDGEVVAVKYADELTNNVPEAFRSEIDPENEIKQHRQMVARLPETPVSKGDTWKRNQEINIGQGQTFFTESEFTYLGSEMHNGKPMEKIGSKILTLKYDLGNGAAIPLELKSSDLKVESSEGVLWYDPATKGIPEANESFHVTGTMTFIANGMELPAELDLTMSFNTKAATKSE